METKQDVTTVPVTVVMAVQGHVTYSQEIDGNIEQRPRCRQIERERHQNMNKKITKLSHIKKTIIHIDLFLVNPSREANVHSINNNGPSEIDKSVIVSLDLQQCIQMSSSVSYHPPL
jgi:hypothetical protein